MDEQLQEDLVRFHSKAVPDRYDLENEWAHQPALYAEVGEWASTVKNNAKVAKAHIDFVYSKLMLDVLNDPNHAGLPKTTEAILKAYITTHADYVEAQEAYFELNKLAGDATTLLDSFEQRKAALRDLVRLYVHNYYMFSDPKDEIEANSVHRGPKPSGNYKNGEAEIMEVRAEKRKQQAMDREADELEENKNG